MSKGKCALLLSVIAGCVAIFADGSSAGLARLTGGSGYSGHLAANKTIRRQQLICDPADAPIVGSTSVTYNPSLVTLSGLDFGPGYIGNGLVEVEGSGGSSDVFLESISSFLVDPAGIETGYAQVSYTLTGTAGTMSPDSGFTQFGSNGVVGVDTDSLMFTYKSGVTDNTVAQYTIYADTGNRPSGNTSDFLTGVGPGGKNFTLGPSQLSSATVSASLVGPGPNTTFAVPLPPAAWTGSAMLLALATVTAVRKTRAAAK